MNRVVVRDICKTSQGDQITLSAEVEFQGRGWKIPDMDDPKEPSGRIYFSFPIEYEAMVARRGDAFVPAFLMQCMFVGSDLHIGGAVSQALLDQMRTLQDIWCSWDPDRLSRIDIHADSIDTPDMRSNRTAAFFSLGVDSFYTLTRNKRIESPPTPPIEYLIYMRGFERPLAEDHSDRVLIQNMIGQIAESIECRTIFGRTNIRRFLTLNWGLAHIGGQAAVALALGAGLDNVLIAASVAYSQMGKSVGSHPLTDPLWSTESTRLIPSGCEVTRQQKTAAIVQHMPEALNYFRVCLNNQKQLNCGHCIKCVHTLIALDMLGKLKEATTLPDQLPKDYVRALLYYPNSSIAPIREHLRIARELGDQRYIGILHQIYRIKRKDEWRSEMYPTWDRLTRPWRNLLRRIRY